MSQGFLYDANEFLIYFIFFGLMLAATEAGFQLGQRYESKTPEKTKSQVSAVEASILAVLGLLLAFTMSMAVSRYEARRHLVLEEANALGTACLRTQLLPEAQGREVLDLLKQYITVRVEYGNSGNDLRSMAAAREKGAALQKEFWSKTVAYAREDPNPVKSGLLLQALNEAIDLESARWVALHDHVPESVIYVIGLVGLLSALLVGFTFGVNGRRQLFSMCALSVAITIVLAVIVDLDRPRSGFIRVSQQPMVDLQRP